MLEHEKTKLDEHLKKRRRRHLVKLRARILAKYRSSRRSAVTLGFSAAMALLCALLTQVESLAKRITAPLGLTFPRFFGQVCYAAWSAPDSSRCFSSGVI